MITLEDAIAKVKETYLDDWTSEGYPEDELIILNEYIIDRPNYWVIPYTSKLLYETGDMKYAIAGNASIIVVKETGEMLETGTAHSIEFYMEEFEKGNLRN